MRMLPLPSNTRRHKQDSTKLAALGFGVQEGFNPSHTTRVTPELLRKCQREANANHLRIAMHVKPDHLHGTAFTPTSFMHTLYNQTKIRSVKLCRYGFDNAKGKPS